MAKLSFLSHNTAERRDYMIRQQSLHLYNASMNRSYAKGIEIGEARGEKRKAVETALNAINLGLSIDIAAKISGLTADEVNLLKNNI